MLMLQFVWLCFSVAAQGSIYMQWAYSSASSPVLLPFGDLQCKAKQSKVGLDTIIFGIRWTTQHLHLHRSVALTYLPKFQETLA